MRSPTRQRLGGGLLLSVCAAACGRPAAAPEGGRPVTLFEAKGLPKVSPGRFFPVASEPLRPSGLEPDGSVPFIEHGLRIVRSPDGAIRRAREIFPESSAVSVLRLPSSLGGGFVFRATQDGATALYRTDDFVGALRPLVRLPFEAADVVVGFDRLIAVSSRTRAAVSIDPATGVVENAAMLPAAAGYGGLAFGDGWVGAVETDVRGVLVTFDAGQSFHPLPFPTTSPGVALQSGRILIGTPTGPEELLSTGELRPADAPALDLQLSGDNAATGDETDDTGAPVPLEPGGAPLELAVRFGIADTDGSAVYVHDGRLVRVRLEDGRVLSQVENGVFSSGECSGIRLGRGLGFACGSAHGDSAIFALNTPPSLVPVARFDGPRAMLPGGSGSVAVRGRCSNESVPNAYCIIGASGQRFEIAVPRPAASRVVALGGGAAAVLLPPRPDSEGELRVLDAKGGTRKARLSLRGVGEEAAYLLRHGLWLDGMTEIEPSVLSGWVFGGSSFLGVRVKLDGTVIAGRIQPEPENAIVAGPRALLRGDSGLSLESTDAGTTWSEVSVPGTLDLEDEGGPRGCTDVGCSLGRFIRVGWGGAANDLVPAPRPKDTPFEPLTFVSFRLKCSMTSESEVLHGAVPVEVGRGPKRSAREEPALESSAFRPFLGLPAPRRAEGDLGFDFGTEDHAVQVRGYVWGRHGTPWDRTGNWVIRGVDRFAVENAVWSTAVSRPPWADEAGAAEAFGSEPTHRVVNEWGAVLDPRGDGGAVLMRTGSRTDLAIVEKDRAIVFVPNVDDAGIERLSGAVKANGAWYLGASGAGRAARIFAVESGQLSTVATLPRIVDDSPGRLVRSSQGDAIGIWVVAHGQLGTRAFGDTWLVYPIDPQKGRALSPLVIPPQVVGRAPRACAIDEEGWILPYEVSPSIAKVDVTNVSDPPAMHHVEARLLAGPRGLCLDALAARVEGEPPKRWIRHGAPVQPGRTVPLSLTDRATDRRWGFRCSP